MRFGGRSAGGELGYAEITTNWSQVGTANSIYDITGLQTTVAARGRPLIVQAFLPVIYHSAAPANAQVLIYEDGNLVSYCRLGFPGTGTVPNPALVRARRQPSAGQHTYKVSVQTLTAGTVTVTGATSGPPHIHVIEA